MADQRWFAGLQVVGERTLKAEEEEQLADLVHDIRSEGMASIAILILAAALVVCASGISLATGWLGPILLGMGWGMMRYLPQRRFFGVRVLMALGHDRRDRTVHICRSGDLMVEVLTHSHAIWSRNGEPVRPPMIAHATKTAGIPHHAAMAANFVRPAAGRDDLFVHQRALTADELTELDTYAPRPSFPMIVLAAVGLTGCAATFLLAVRGHLTTLFPPFIFFVAGVWALSGTVRRWRRRRRFASDLEAGYVIIARQEISGELSGPVEFLPFSEILWTSDGEPALWRKVR